MSSMPKSWIEELGVYEPGRPMDELARELGLESADEITKLASNENALGPSPKAIDAMRAEAVKMHLYPDGGAFHLRRALAQKLDMHMDEIMVGNGSNELIVFLSHVYLEEGTSIVMAERAFVVYKLVASSFGAETISVPMKDLRHDLGAMLDAIRPDTKIVYISNPNNPTGTMVEEDEIVAFMEKVPSHVVVVFDEAYIELLPPERQPDTLRYVREGRNVCVLRTFSKTYGLAGLRVGYAAAPKKLINLLHKVRQPFNANAMAQAAARAALEDDEHVAKTRDMVEKGLAYLGTALEDAGIEYVPSVANFMLIKVGAGRDVFDALQKRHIIARPMDGYGLPEYVRITVGTQKQNEAFISALNAVLAE